MLQKKKHLKSEDTRNKEEIQAKNKGGKGKD